MAMDVHGSNVGGKRMRQFVNTPQQTLNRLRRNKTQHSLLIAYHRVRLVEHHITWFHCDVGG
jgi:hypothetical protein